MTRNITKNTRAAEAEDLTTATEIVASTAPSSGPADLPSTTVPRRSSPGSKTEQLIRLLSGKNGADVAAVNRKLGWQAHTTRAAISGLLKAGYAVTHEKSKNGKPGRYQIKAGSDAKGSE